MCTNRRAHRIAHRVRAATARLPGGLLRAAGGSRALRPPVASARAPRALRWAPLRLLARARLRFAQIRRRPPSGPEPQRQLPAATKRQEGYQQTPFSDPIALHSFAILHHNFIEKK